jgi:hypothetical protein
MAERKFHEVNPYMFRDHSSEELCEIFDECPHEISIWRGFAKKIYGPEYVKEEKREDLIKAKREGGKIRLSHGFLIRVHFAGKDMDTDKFFLFEKLFLAGASKEEIQEKIEVSAKTLEWLCSSYTPYA